MFVFVIILQIHTGCIAPTCKSQTYLKKKKLHSSEYKVIWFHELVLDLKYGKDKMALKLNSPTKYI